MKLLMNYPVSKLTLILLRQRMQRMAADNGRVNLDVIFHMIHSVVVPSNNHSLSFPEQIDTDTVAENVSIRLHADKRPDDEHSRRHNLPICNNFLINTLL